MSKRITLRAALILPVLILAASCSGISRPYITVDGFAQGSTYHIVYYDSLRRDLRPEIEQLLEDFDNSLSLYNPNSLLTRLNRNDPGARPDQWITECFELSQQISHDTEGAFDITVRPLMTAYRLGDPQGPHILSQAEIDSLKEFVDYRKVRIEQGELIKDDPRLQLDFNAIAQGYTADLIGSMFDSLGIADYMVEVGGEIVCRGRNPKDGEWRVGIDRPTEGNMLPGQDLHAILTLTDAGLVTSGNYRKYAYDSDGNRVVHTLDPVTGRPVTHNLLSATIIAPTSAMADGYATVCMVVGLEKSRTILERHPELEGYLIYAGEGDQMLVYMTPGMKKHLAKK